MDRRYYAILKEPQFDGAYKVNARDGFRGAFYLEEYDVYVSTSYGIGDIIRFIEKLLLMLVFETTK